MSLTLVDPEITRAKFRRELQFWKENSNAQERGWVLLSENDETLSVEIAFLAGIATSMPTSFLPVVACAVRITYENYDLWPPSLTFIDVFSGKPTKPHVRAFMSTPTGPTDVLIDGHPDAPELPFLCLPGVREYHSHPQHTGDDWLLHRSLKEGSLTTISERVWRFMVKNILGLRLSIQALPTLPFQAQVGVQIAQGDLHSASLQQSEVVIE